MISIQRLLGLTLLGSSLFAAVACGNDDDGAAGPGGSGGSGGSGGEQTGQSCTSAAQCFPNIADGSAVHGTVVCMDRVTNGYCTHECETDADCCAIPGECNTDLPQVCSPFESTGKKYCFLSCEESDIRAHETQLFADGGIDADRFCSVRANVDFGCRSTGGGSQNRKVCMP